jgi:hypothetical protein
MKDPPKACTSTPESPSPAFAEESDSLEMLIVSITI